MEQRYQLGYEIKTVSNLMKRRIANNKIIADSNQLTGMQGWFIGYIYHRSNDNRDTFQRDMEAEFSIRRSTATGILQLMEKNNLIIKEAVDYDARLKKLILTPKAVAIHEDIMNEIDKIETELCNGLTEQEVEAFASIIEKMKKNIE